MKVLLFAAVALPIVFGFALVLLGKRIKSVKTFEEIFISGLLLCAALLTAAAMSVPSGETFTLFELTDKVMLAFTPDSTGKLFLFVTVIVWVLAGVFSLAYMHEEENLPCYYGFYMISLGALSGFDMAGNLVTLYMFFEFVTLAMAPLVFHNRNRQSVYGGYKYLFFSLFGAYMALFGLYFLYHYAGGDLSFVPGGYLSHMDGGFFLAVVFLMILGFSVKAGMFPLHAWLPTAHPVAPSPASAALSGIIVKCGVLAIIRTIFYVVGPDAIRGTWVQTAWSVLALITVFMGSLLAYMEPVFKKRLAYSTVSQLSYILFGLSLLTDNGMVGSLTHVVFHALIKCALFLTAGAVIFGTGNANADEVYGLGKKNPLLMLSYTIVSLGLVGIPPLSGFISKWYLCLGALDGANRVLGIVGIACLLVSALLTAGYLLPPAIHAFFPGEHEVSEFKAPMTMTLPILLLAILTILFGIYPQPLLAAVRAIAEVL